MVSLSDAAHYLGIHPSTLRRWIGNGKVKAVPRVPEGAQPVLGVVKRDETPVTVEMKEIIRVQQLMAAERAKLMEKKTP